MPFLQLDSAGCNGLILLLSSYIIIDATLNYAIINAVFFHIVSCSCCANETCMKLMICIHFLVSGWCKYNQQLYIFLCIIFSPSQTVPGLDNSINKGLERGNLRVDRMSILETQMLVKCNTTNDTGILQRYHSVEYRWGGRYASVFIHTISFK